jgi:hypothetical protein
VKAASFLAAGAHPCTSFEWQQGRAIEIREVLEFFRIILCVGGEIHGKMLSFGLR